MSTINPQIDAAVVLMKARAAEFDHSGRESVDEWVATGGRHAAVNDWLTRAITNADRARDNLHENGFPSGDYPEYRQEFREDLLDTMNLCALALSVLPKGAS